MPVPQCSHGVTQSSMREGTRGLRCRQTLASKECVTGGSEPSPLFA